MSLEGAKFICLDKAGNHGEILVAKGRKFSMGYYVNCDLVLADERAKGVHCEIECDAFGRVTIRNLSPDKPILVNGSSVEIKRILYNNSKLSILDKEYLWQFPKSSSNEFEDLNSDALSTPQKQIGIPEQPPSSCPDFKLHRELPKRFTVHNFAYCIQSDEEGNTSADSNDESITEDKKEGKDQEVASDKNQTNKPNIELISENKLNDVGNRSVTPEPPVGDDNSTALLETPKMNLINFTTDKENKSTHKKNKQLLTLCQPSHVVITSFSPRETGVKIEKSFTAIIKPKVQVTQPPTTPKSVYSTPKSEMDVDVDEEELINFHTPSTSKKAAGTASKVLKTSSMHLIDLTTPHKLRHGSPFLKSALKASAKKNLTETTDASLAKLAVDEQIGLSALPLTPVVNCSNSGLATPSSVISVSSTDTSSVVELTSDGSELGITPSCSGVPITPIKSQVKTGACTPKRTPQSLMKRALLTSAKKQATTPQRGNNGTTTTTPRRETINRIPLRSNLALLGSPVTPKANKTDSQLPRRHSMSTPTRKSILARNRFDNSPTTGNFAVSSPSSSTSLASRRSSINPISAARALPTSTPLAGSSNNSSLRNRAACKTSPLHKVRKSVGGIPLSSHISKSRKAIALPVSSSKLTSVREKSPQQIVSGRLVSRARRSFCTTPISTRARNRVTAAETPPTCPSSILKDTQIEQKPSEQRKVVLFSDKLPPEGGEMDDLSRTFIVDSDDDDAADDDGNEKDKPKDATFSPEKDKIDETDKASRTINTTFSPEKKTCDKVDVQKALNEKKEIEIPVDVQEIASKEDNEYVLEKDTAESNVGDQKTNNELAVNNKTENKKVNNEKQYDTADERYEENKEIISEKYSPNKETLAIDNNGDSLVTEESFAEIINDAQEVIEYIVDSHNVKETIETIEGPRESSQTEIINDAQEDIDEICETHNYKEPTEGPRESSQTESQESFGDIVNITQDETEEEQHTKPTEKTTDNPNATLEKERVDDPNQSLDKDKLEAAEVWEIGFGEESIVENLETENPKDTAAKKIKPNETEDNTDNVDKTKPETIVLIKEDNVAENIETESNVVVGIVKESEITEHLAREEKIIDDAELNINDEKNELEEENINIEKENPEVYKPIYEDITLEGSLIEKETKDLEDHKPIKQPLYEDITLEGSLIEESEKHEFNLHEIKDQKTPNDSKNIEQLNVEECKEETLEKLESERVEAEEENQLILKCSLEEPKTETASLKGNKLAEAKSDIITEASSNYPDNVVQMEINETAVEPQTENNKIAEVQEDTRDDHNPAKDSQIVDQFEVNETNEPHKQTEGKNELEKIQEADALQQLNLHRTGIETDENTSKLLEEIEDVLNKSDEINQKQYEEMRSLDIETTPLTEEFECEETNISETDETEVITLDKNPQEDLHEEIVAETTNIDMTIEEIQSHTSTKIEPENVDERWIVSNCPENPERKTAIVLKTVAPSEETVTETKSQSLDIVAEIEAESPKMLAVEVIPETTIKINEHSPSVSSRKKKFENTTTLTPRRTRRTSLTTEVSSSLAADSSLTPRRCTRRTSLSIEISSTSQTVEATLTPRRSTRRASMSCETTNTSTSTKNATRRVSLSATNETPLTPKRISSRTSSVSMDDKPLLEAKTPRTKTPLKQLEQLITEENTEDMEAIIEEDEEPSVKNVTSNEESKEIVSEDVAKETVILESKSTEITDEIIAEEILTSKEKNVAEEGREEIVSNELLEFKNSNEKTVEVVVEEILKAVERNVFETKQETDDELEITDKKNLHNAAVTDEVSVEATAFLENKKSDENLKQHKIDEPLPNTDISITLNDSKDITKVIETVEMENFFDNAITTNAVIETIAISDDQGNESISDKAAVAKNDKAIASIVDETISISDDKEYESISDKAAVAKNDNKEIASIVDETISISDDKENESISDKAVAKNDNTEIVSIVDETISILDDRSAEEFGNEIVESKEISTPKLKKSVKIVADSSKTPVMTEMRDLLKSPKAEFNTPQLAGSRDLVKTPKQKVEIDEEEVEKFTGLAQLIKAPKTESNLEEIATTKKSVKLLTDSPKTPIMTGMRELLKTPKADKTPKFAGLRNLVQTPKKTEDSENLAGLADMVKTPQAKISQILLVERLEEIPTTSAKDANLRGVKELLKTPKSCSTPRFKGMRELMQTPKMCSTPLMGGIKELMNSPATMANENMDKFLKTPTAKNIMIPSLPSSAVIEKSTDSIEVSTEYDLNATNEGEMSNLEALFKTPVASRFVERITASYYGDEGEDHDEDVAIFNPTIKETLQDKLNKSAEDAYDELTGQESQIKTPIRKFYPRKSLALDKPQLAQSPFSTADVLSDLPKTDVEEWIETLDQAETTVVVEDDDDDGRNAVVGGESESLYDVPNDEVSYLEDSFVEQNTSFTNDESIIPETCAKVYLNEKCLANVTSTSEVMLNLSTITKTNSKDPLAKSTTKQMPKAPHPVTLMDAEISGIDLLDQTVESVQEEELSMLEEPLIMEEVSIFEEHLVVSDNDSEADLTVNNATDVKEEQHSLANLTLGANQGDGGEYDLSEPLLVSDNEDLDQSLQLKELVDSQEQLVDIIDLETSEIEDDTSKGSSEDNKSICQKPQSSNSSKYIDKEIMEKSAIEDVESSVIQEISSRVTTSIIDDSKKTDALLTEEKPNEDSEYNKKPERDNERLRGSVLENSIIEDSFTEGKRDDSMAKITSITETVLNTNEIEENIKDDTTTKHARNELEISKASQNYKELDSEIQMKTKDPESEVICNAPQENIESLDKILQTDETLEKSVILEKEIENEKKLEITIKGIRKSSDIFMDDSLNENYNNDIKAVETSSSNKVEMCDTLKVSPTETKIDFDSECEVNCMNSSINESSKVDDAFADKTTNDEKDVENESAMVEVTTKEMVVKNSETELTASESIDLNKEIVAIEDIKVSKEVNVKDNSQIPTYQAVKEVSVKNEMQLEEFSIAQELSDDGNPTASENVKALSEVLSANEISKSNQKEDKIEKISKDQLTNTTCNVINEPVENIKEPDESLSQTNKDSSDDVAELITETISEDESIEAVSELNKTGKGAFDKSATAQTESESSKEPSEDINVIDESRNKFEESNDGNQLDVPVSLHIVHTEVKDLDKETTEEIKPFEKKLEITKQSPIVDIEKSLHKAEKYIIIAEESKTESTTKSTDLEIYKTTEEESQNKKSSIVEQSETPKTIKHKFAQKITALDETTDKQHQQNSENIQKSTKDISFEEKIQKLAKESTEVDIAKTSSADNNIEIVQTYDIKVKIIDNEKSSTEIKSDNELLTVHLSTTCSTADLESTTNKANDLKATAQTVEDVFEHQRTKCNIHKLTVLENAEGSVHEAATTRKDRMNEEAVLEKRAENEEQSNVSIKELVEEDKTELIEVTEFVHKEAKITAKETTVCMAEGKREKVRPQRRKRTASDSSQGSVHEDDNKSTVRRGRRKVQKSPIEETLVEEIRENEGNLTVSTEAAVPDTDTYKENLVDQEVKETFTEQIQETELSSALIVEDVKPNLTPDVAKTLSVEKGEEQSPDDLGAIIAEAGERAKEKDVKRGPRKPTVSECSQGSAPDDDSSTRRARRKVQKTQIEQTLLEANLDYEERLIMETPEETLLQHKEETHQVELPIVSTQEEESNAILLENPKAEEQIPYFRKETNNPLEKRVEERKEHAIKQRGRRKQTVSESSQSSVNGDDDTTHSQRIQQKVQKIRVEEPLVEEELPTSSTANIGQKTVSSLNDELVTESNTAKYLIGGKQVTFLAENQDNKALPNVSTPTEEIKEIYSTKEALVKDEEKAPNLDLPVVSAQLEETNTIILQNVKGEVPNETKVQSEGKDLRKEHAVKRGRRKQTLSESSQGSVNDTTHSQRGRHKVQKIRVEEPLVEEELPTTSTANIAKKQEKRSTVSIEKPIIESIVATDTPDLNVKVTEPLIYEKQVLSSDLPQEEAKEEAPNVPFKTVEDATKHTVKHGRRKQTVSESNRDSNHNESSTRRGRRKVLKIPIDKPLVEEKHESEKLSNVRIEKLVEQTETVLKETLSTDGLEFDEKNKDHAFKSSHDSKHAEETLRNSPHKEQKTLVEENIIEHVNEDEILPITTAEIKEAVASAVNETETITINETKAIEIEGFESNKLEEPHSSQVVEEISTENEQVEADASAEVGQEQAVDDVAAKQATNRGGRKAISDDEIIDIKHHTVQDDHNEKYHKLKLKSTKVRGKRTRTASDSSQGSVHDEEPTKRRARQHKQTHNIDEAIIEETESKVVVQTAENPTIDDPILNNELAQKSSVEETANEKKRDEPVEPVEPLTPHLIDNQKRPSTADKPETSVKSNLKEQVETKVVVDEPTNYKLTDVQITAVNLEPEDLHSSADVKEKEVRGRRGRHHVIAEDEHHGIKPASKRRAAVPKHIAVDHPESGLVSKRRVGRRKQDHDQEDHTHAIHVTADDHENSFTDTNLNEEPKKGRGRKKKDEHPVESEHPKTSEHEQLEMEISHEESTHTASAGTSSKRRVGRRKQDHEQEEYDHNIQVTVDSKLHENKSMESLAPEEPKKGRGRRKKDEHPIEPEKFTTSHSPQAKPRGRKRKESHTDNQELHGAEDHHHQEQKDAQAETKIKLPTAEVVASHTPQRATAASRRGRKPSALDVDRHAHIVAEAAELTPSKRPLRKAATVYHNYDETSNDAVLPTKTKKKSDSPRKSLEAVKSSPSATVTITHITTDSSPTSSSTPAATTARGRTRKPTARVQQFLEEERAKAETPKKRGLLSAVTEVTNTPTPQRMPGRRGRKPSTIDVEVDTAGTPQTSKRGRGKAITHTEELEKETAKVIEEKVTEHTTPPAAAKGRRGGRKAKITPEVDQHHRDDEDEPPPAKKSPVALEAEKQKISPELAEPTPTRSAGRRGAATAAKARIEEDALAAAAIDPPKRARAKKTPSAKIVAALIAATTDTEGHSSEMDDEQNKAKSLKAEDLNSGEDIEISDIVENPVNKRGARKVAASTSSTDSPAVPSKRGRKAKITSEATEIETAGEIKATRGAGRVRKNVHFDEIQAAEKAAETLEHQSTTEQTSEESAPPAKRGTRTRRK